MTIYSLGDTTATAVAAGVALTPITLWLAHHTRTRPHRPRPAEEAATAAIVGALTAMASAAGGLPTLLPLIVLGVAAAVVDAEEARLPNALTGALFAATTMVVALDLLINGNVARGAQAVIAMLVVLTGALIAKIVHSSVIGWGDVKLLPSLAATLGWWQPGAISIALVQWALLVVVAAALAGFGLRSRGEVVPFGPALLVGTLDALTLVPR
jgi:Type IV leader peptidase family